MSATRRPSFRQVINAKCKQCIYDPADRGTWRQQVEGCTVTVCALWPLRPLSRVRVVPVIQAGLNPDTPAVTPSSPHQEHERGE